MIQARDEEIQITWACSAQNPDMLPKKKKNAAQAKEELKQKMNRIYFS